MNEETKKILKNEIERLSRNVESYDISIDRIHNDLDKILLTRNNQQFRINKLKEDLNNE